MEVNASARGLQVRASDDSAILYEMLEAGRQNDDVVVHYRQVGPDEGLVSIRKPGECGSCGSSRSYSIWQWVGAGFAVLLAVWYTLD